MINIKLSSYLKACKISDHHQAIEKLVTTRKVTSNTMQEGIEEETRAAKQLDPNLRTNQPLVVECQRVAAAHSIQCKRVHRIGRIKVSDHHQDVEELAKFVITIKILKSLQS